MKKLKSALVVAAAAVLISAVPVSAQQKKAASTGGNSPHETISTVIGDRRTGNRITISYGRPFAKDRKIWGGLVPFGQAWRTGSDEATLLITQQPLVIGAATIPAGAYVLYTVPAEDGSCKLAFATKLGGWGIPVDEKNDLVRVDMKKEATAAPVEQFTMAISATPAGAGVLKMMWENTQYSVDFTVKK